MADRFGGGPFLYWDIEADRRERLLNLLSLEGEVAKVYAGLEPGEEVFGYGPDGYADD